jgi:hypothetical protein
VDNLVVTQIVQAVVFPREGVPLFGTDIGDSKREDTIFIAGGAQFELSADDTDLGCYDSMGSPYFNAL